MKIYFSDLGSSLSCWNLFHISIATSNFKNDNFGFLPNHSSDYVVSTDLDGALLNVNAAVFNA